MAYAASSQVFPINIRPSHTNTNTNTNINTNTNTNTNTNYHMCHPQYPPSPSSSVKSNFLNSGFLPRRRDTE